MAFQRTASIAPATTFGNQAPVAAAAQPAANKRPPAQFWLNVGMTYDNANETGDASVFVSLPLGIPLDDMKALPTGKGSDWYREFNTARNDLAAKIMALCGELQPGEERLVNLQVQVRRVAEDAAPLASTRFGISDLAL